MFKNSNLQTDQSFLSEIRDPCSTGGPSMPALNRSSARKTSKP